MFGGGGDRLAKMLNRTNSLVSHPFMIYGRNYCLTYINTAKCDACFICESHRKEVGDTTRGPQALTVT